METLETYRQIVKEYRSTEQFRQLVKKYPLWENYQQHISVDFAKGMLFFMPAATPTTDFGGLGSPWLKDAVILSFSETDDKKALSLFKSLSLSRLVEFIPPWDKEEHRKQIKQILASIRITSIQAFASCALSFSVSLNGNELKFQSLKYDRGGFYADIHDYETVLPIDASAAAISRAINNTLEHCTGKGDKRLADFLAICP